MKKLVFYVTLAAAALTLGSCSNNTKWEYKVVKIEGQVGVAGNFGEMAFSSPTNKLDQYGEEGWELVSTYTEIATVHPNFGNSEYVTGLQPNTRTTAVNYVFKREK